MITLLLLSAFILSASFPLISFALSLTLSAPCSLFHCIFSVHECLCVHLHLCVAMKTKPTFRVFLNFSIDFKSKLLHYLCSFRVHCAIAFEFLNLLTLAMVEYTACSYIPSYLFKKITWATVKYKHNYVHELHTVGIHFGGAHENWFRVFLVWQMEFWFFAYAWFFFQVIPEIARREIMRNPWKDLLLAPPQSTAISSPALIAIWCDKMSLSKSKRQKNKNSNKIRKLQYFGDFLIQFQMIIRWLNI